MKVSVIFGVLMMFLACSGCSHLQGTRDGAAVIEFERQEDNGSVNIVPATLILSDHQKVTLSGGDRGVVSVAPGIFYVTAFSIDPYSLQSEATAWRSPRTRFKVASGERLRVSVEPAASGSTYTGGWTIQAANKALQRTRPLPFGCNFGPSRAGSLSFCR